MFYKLCNVSLWKVGNLLDIISVAENMEKSVAKQGYSQSVKFDTLRELRKKWEK